MKLAKLLTIALTLALSACAGGGEEPQPKPTDMNRVLDTILNFGDNYKLTVETSRSAYKYGYPDESVDTIYTSREGLSYCTSYHSVTNTLMTFEEYKNFVLDYTGGEDLNNEELEEAMELITEYYGFVHTVEGDKHRIYYHVEQLPAYYFFNIATPYIYDYYAPSYKEGQIGRYYKSTRFIEHDIASTVYSGFDLSFLSKAKTHLKWDETNRWFNYDINYAKDDGYDGYGYLEQLHVVVDEENQLKDIEFVIDESGVKYEEKCYSKVLIEKGGQKVVAPTEASLLTCEHEDIGVIQGEYNNEYYHYQMCLECEDVHVDTIEKCTFDEDGWCTECDQHPIASIVILESDDHIPLITAAYNPVNNYLIFIIPDVDATVEGSEDPEEIVIEHDDYEQYPSNYDFYSTYVYQYKGLTFVIEETGPIDDWSKTRYVVIIGCTYKDNVVKGGTLTTYMTGDTLPIK